MRENTYPFAISMMALLSCLLSGCSGSGEDNQQLSCSGSVTPFVTPDQKAETVANQQIAVHIRKQKISFSGNPLLGGENVAVCPPGNSGWADGGHYFDSEACTDSPHHGPTRVYGTYNELSGTLDLTNEIASGKYTLIQGNFSCKRTDAGSH